MRSFPDNWTCGSHFLLCICISFSASGLRWTHGLLKRGSCGTTDLTTLSTLASDAGLPGSFPRMAVLGCDLDVPAQSVGPVSFSSKMYLTSKGFFYSSGCCPGLSHCHLYLDNYSSLLLASLPPSHFLSVLSPPNSQTYSQSDHESPLLTALLCLRIALWINFERLNVA